MSTKTDLFSIEDAWLHPGHVRALFNLVDATLDETERQRLHHEQLHLVLRQLRLGRDLGKVQLSISRWPLERHLQHNNEYILCNYEVYDVDKKQHALYASRFCDVIDRSVCAFNATRHVDSYLHQAEQRDFLSHQNLVLNKIKLRKTNSIALV